MSNRRKYSTDTVSRAKVMLDALDLIPPNRRNKGGGRYPARSLARISAETGITIEALHDISRNNTYREVLPHLTRHPFQK